MDLNPSAARSLGEGLEKTLTVHRLHVPPRLRKTLASTNVIESAFSIVERVCANVKRWHAGDQRERWVGSGLLVAEKQFRRVQGHKQIPILLRELEALVPSKSEALWSLRRDVFQKIRQGPVLRLLLKQKLNTQPIRCAAHHPRPKHHWRWWTTVVGSASQFHGQRDDCSRWPLEVGENESTAGANVPHDMACSSTSPVKIIRGDVLNHLARRLPPVQLACCPLPQPLCQPPGWLPSGRLENPVDGQGVVMHKRQIRT
jgi:hypothetical protein